MHARTPSDQIWDAAGVVVPLAVVAVTVLARWPGWVAVVLVAIDVAVYARLAGRERAAVSAMFATAGLVLVVERDGAGPLPVRLAELGVMTGLLAIAATVGRAPSP